MSKTKNFEFPICSECARRAPGAEVCSMGHMAPRKCAVCGVSKICQCTSKEAIVVQLSREIFAPDPRMPWVIGWLRRALPNFRFTLPGRSAIDVREGRRKMRSETDWDAGPL